MHTEIKCALSIDLCVFKNLGRLPENGVAVTKFKLFRRNCITFTSLSEHHSQKIKVEDGNAHNLFAVCFHKKYWRLLEIIEDYWRLLKITGDSWRKLVMSHANCPECFHARIDEHFAAQNSYPASILGITYRKARESSITSHWIYGPCETMYYQLS